MHTSVIIEVTVNSIALINEIQAKKVFINTQEVVCGCQVRNVSCGLGRKCPLVTYFESILTHS